MANKDGYNSLEGKKQCFNFPLKIVIEKINLEWVIDKADSLDNQEIISRWDLNEKGVVHYPNTVLPGEAGVCAVAGHRTTYGAPFLNLEQLEVGDKIVISSIEDPDTFMEYEVQFTKIISPADIDFINLETKDSWLALTTCEPKLSSSKRLLIMAKA